MSAHPLPLQQRILSVFDVLNECALPTLRVLLCCSWHGVACAVRELELKRLLVEDRRERLSRYGKPARIWKRRKNPYT